MNNPTLQYYMHDGPGAFRFELAGRLNREGARRLDQDWRTASSVIGDRRLLVDMTFVTQVDEQGRELITRWHRDGARLIANSKASRALAESIIGEHSLNEDDAPASDVPGSRFVLHFLGAASLCLCWSWLCFRSRAQHPAHRKEPLGGAAQVTTIWKLAKLQVAR